MKPDNKEKEKEQLSYKKNQLISLYDRIKTLKVDERICDGYYYAASFKQLSRYLKKPELLEGPSKNKENINV